MAYRFGPFYDLPITDNSGCNGFALMSIEHLAVPENGWLMTEFDSFIKTASTDRLIW